MAVGKDDSKCGVCQSKVTNKTGGLKCSAICEKWHHYKCVNITKEEYDSFRKIHDKFLWHCDQCKSEVIELIVQRNELSIVIESISDRNVLPQLQLVLDELERVSSNYVKLEKRMSKMEEVNRNRARPPVENVAQTQTGSDSDIIVTTPKAIVKGDNNSVGLKSDDSRLFSLIS